MSEPEWQDWYMNTPPRQTWVWATYSLERPWMLVKTCKHGCCVQDPFFGSMLLPNFWKKATDEDVAKVEEQLRNAKPINIRDIKDA